MSGAGCSNIRTMQGGEKKKHGTRVVSDESSESLVTVKNLRCVLHTHTRRIYFPLGSSVVADVALFSRTNEW